MNNKEARYVIRIAHPGAYSPADGPKLLAEVRERLRPLEAYATNLRVSRGAMEFDLFFKPEKELQDYLDALKPIGPLLTAKRLDLLIPTPPAEQVVSEARGLFNEERYWETHEVLEALWKTAKGDEKQLLQGLILTAAALVHAQKNELKVVRPMLEDAARRLENQPAAYYSLDVQRFRLQVKKALTGETAGFPMI